MSFSKETRTTLWWLIFIVIAAVLTALFLYPRMQILRRNQRELQRQQQLLARKKRDSERLRNKVEALQNSPAAVEREARERHNLTRPGETVMIYSETEQEK